MNAALAPTNGKLSAHDEQKNPVCFTPRFDIYEDDNGYVLIGDLPGVDADHLEVQCHQQELTIAGRVPERCHGRAYIAEEYGVGDFRRAFTIGAAIDQEAIQAEMANGVLTVRLPKIAEAKPRKITVKAG
jgi:HSP20 family protein